MRVLRAVSDETRFGILEKLGDGELCVCKLPGLTGESQPNVSKHLRVLNDAGLVGFRVEGRKRLYSLSKLGKKVLRDVLRW